MSFYSDGYQLFASTVLENGGFIIPSILIKFYTYLGITEAELTVIIHLLYWRHVEQERFPIPEKIGQYMNIDCEEIKNLIASLIEKKYLSVEPYYNSSTGRWQNSFSFSTLWSKLAQLVIEKQIASPETTKEISATSDRYGELYHTFEKEFGRPLSPLESDQLRVWIHSDQISIELLQEALKRAALRGALNFRYIDSILKDWQRNNVRTVTEAALYDDKKKKKTHVSRYKKTNTTKKEKDKYRDLYRLNSKG